MIPLNRAVAALARQRYAALLRRHPASVAGYDAQMAATFDTLLRAAEQQGVIAIVTLTARECAGLIASARAKSAGVPQHPRNTPMIETLAQDLRFAWRAFRRRPAFTAALVLTLALGIGANTAIFSVVNAVLLQRLPFPNPGRLVMVWEDASAVGFPRNTPAVGNYADWKATIRTFDDVAALDQRSFNLTGDAEPEKVDGAGVTANLFTVLDVSPLIGRTWRADEDVPGNRVAVLSYALWQRRFGGDAGILNRTVQFNDTPYTILGVMPPRFQVVSPDLQIWVPMNFTAAELGDRGSHYLNVIARLATGATLAQANGELSALAARSATEHPDTNRQIGMFAVPLLDDYVGDTRAVLIVLLAAVAGVLLVACANVANLLLTGAMGRSREMAVRAALGANRRRLIRQLMTESLLLAVCGGALGIAVANWSFGTLAHLVPAPLADLSRVGLDNRVLAATAAVTMLTGALFGLAPAWRASRVDFGAGSSTRGLVGGPGRLGNMLVVTEIALATVLLVGAGLFIQSYRTISHVNLGFTPDHVLTAQVQLPRSSYASFNRRLDFVRSVTDRAGRLPGVVSVGYTSAAPLQWKGGTSGFMPEGRPINRQLSYDAVNRVVSPGYMTTIGMTLREGRHFTEHDDVNGEPVAIINDRMAKQYWPGEDPLGRRFRAGSEGDDAALRTIVGIVDDTRVMGIDQPTKAEMYFPIAQSPNNWMWPRDIAIRVAGDPSALVAELRATVWSVDRTQPISRIQTLDDIVSDELQGRRTQMTLMSAFAGLALLLSTVGVYGVLSYSVSTRTREIGLRLALGGAPGRVRALIIRQGLTLAAIGLLIGLTASMLGATLVSRLLFEVSPHDPWTFAIQACVLGAACVAATYLPARRASRVDPMAALRVE